MRHHPRFNLDDGNPKKCTQLHDTNTKAVVPIESHTDLKTRSSAGATAVRSPPTFVSCFHIGTKWHCKECFPSNSFFRQFTTLCKPCKLPIGIMSEKVSQFRVALL